MDNLVISNLNKTYSNGVVALDNVSLDIPIGLFGLLGPNGAGKSTLMRTIATLQQADSGSIKFGDLDVLIQKNEVRKLLGYLPQEFGLYPKISATVLLDHFAILKGISNKTQRKEIVSALLHLTNLYEHRKKNLGTFSGGMKQRFGIAQALLANPKLVVVDEPTAGLDPAERNRFYDLLSSLGEQTIIILSTHIVEDVKELCTRMAIINQGKVLLEGNPAEAINNLQDKVFSKVIRREERDHYKEEYNVISDRLLLGQPIIHVISEKQPGDGFKPVISDLSDVYFSLLFGQMN